jgi:competence protein ComEC
VADLHFVNPQTNSRPAQQPSGGRQPLLWAALAFAAGIATGVYTWRPSLWWAAAFVVIAASGVFLSRRRWRSAFILGMGTLFVLGAFIIQVSGPDSSGESRVLQFADGSEVVVTAHVTKEGTPQEEGGNVRQRLDLATEQIARGNEQFVVQSGLRVSIYEPQPKPELEQEQRQEARGAPVRLFHYGERLRFPAKLSAPRNFRNPGAFDYRAYLKENGIAALASTKSASVEVLPGFSGSRVELWRSRIHRSVIQKIHALWPPREAALMDAMVIGEDTFINRPARMDFQRSGTYHVLVVSGMNVSILALVTFWFLRRLRMSDLIAGTITVSVMVAYAFLTALGAPVWRATLMLALYLGTRLLYREKSMLNAIGAAALGLMIINPRVLFGASFQLTFLCVWLVAAVAMPILERTTLPLGRGSRHVDSISYDFVLPPRVAQFRLDLRLIAARLKGFFGCRVPLPALALSSRLLLGAGELLMISVIMQIGLALPMAYYFHRATIVGLPANMLVVALRARYAGWAGCVWRISVCPLLA